MKNKEVGGSEGFESEFILRELLENESTNESTDEEKKTRVTKSIDWKGWIPKRFWEVLSKEGIDQERLREIIEEELSKKS